MDDRSRCANHPTEAAVTRCDSCGRRLCPSCWLRKVDQRPWCEACIDDLERSARNKWPFAVTFLALTLAVVVAGWRVQTRDGGEASVEIWGGVLVGAILAAGVVVFREDRRSHGKRIEGRRDDDVPLVRPEDRVGHPYRVSARRMARIVAPPLSGRATALVMCLCLGLTGVAIPMALHLPRWVEYEIALGAWWLIWAGVLSPLLYRGWRLSDDLVLRAPRLPLGGGQDDKPANKAKPGGSSLVSSAGSGCADVGCSDAGGCGEAIAIVLILAVLLVAAWLLVELIAPAVFFGAYVLVRGALARVANDEHGCDHRLARSVGWGTLWATVYVLPLTVLVWAAHAGVSLLQR